MAASYRYNFVFVYDNAHQCTQIRTLFHTQDPVHLLAWFGRKALNSEETHVSRNRPCETPYKWFLTTEPLCIHSDSNRYIDIMVR